MTDFRHLPEEQILALHTAAVDLGLAAEAQDTLLAGLSQAFVTQLEIQGRKDAQLLATLFKLNGIEQLEGGDVPLLSWLRIARQLSRERREGAVFDRTLQALVGRRWIEISLDRAGDDLQVSARDSRGERIAARNVGAAIVACLAPLAAAMQSAAAAGTPLDAPRVTELQGLHRALVGEASEPLLSRRRSISSGPTLLRLALADASLHAIPWEAACAPGEAMGFWASALDVLPVRSVPAGEPRQAREVRGAVRVLAIAPTGTLGVALLEQALSAGTETGEIDWLDPIEGPATSLPALFDRLGREPIPHVLHLFLGCAGPTERSDDEGTRRALELLAQQIKAGCRGFLRLVVLEAGEGLLPSTFAWAAEKLARAGVDAVVTYVWPIRAEVSLVFTERLYRALAGADRTTGDIALALNEARLAVLGTFAASAEAFAPIVYLRDDGDGVIFDFKGRKLVPPASPPRSLRGGARTVDPALERLLAGPFSLVLGDRGLEERTALDGLADRLGKALLKASDPAPPGLPLSALAQRFAFHRGVEELDAEFQRVSRARAPASPLLDALARFLRGGVHTTLLRSPLFEHALAEHARPGKIVVMQPGDAGTTLLCHEPGSDEWEEPGDTLETLDLERELVVLRLYRGKTPEQIIKRSLLTEDDYLFALREIEAALPSQLSAEVLRAIASRPVLMIGLSLLSWDHRVLLRRLFGHRPLPSGSLVLLEPGSRERAFWEKGLGLPGAGGILVVETAPEELAASLASLARGGAR